MFDLKLIDRLKFYIERQLAKGAIYQLIVAWVCVVLVSVVGGVLVTALHGPGETYNENMWWAFLRLTDPGYLGDDEGVLRRMISVVLTVLGYVLFMGTLVAIMTQWLFAKMRLLEQGLTPVSLKRHITVLGWTSRTIPVLLDILARGQLHDSYEDKRVRSKISVLADDITEGPSALFYSNTELNRHRRQVILRSGSMLNPEDLHRVAASEARVVIIPAQPGSVDTMLTHDAEAIKVLLSLNAAPEGSHLPLVIVELQNAEKIPLAKHSYRGPMQLIASDITIARAFAQSVVNPGISDVIDFLMVDANGCQLYIASAANLKGRPWKEVGAHYHAAITCGVVREQGGRKVPILAPGKDFIVNEGDELILLADHERDIVYIQDGVTAPAILPLENGAAASSEPEFHNILLLGWNARVPKVIEELAQHHPGQLKVTSVSTSGVEDRRILIDDPNVQCEFISADYTRPSVLSKQLLNGFDSVLIFATDRLESGEEADARSIVANQLLDLLLQGKVSRPQVLVELTDPANAVYVSASKHTLRSEVVQSSAIISHLLSQLAVFPQLRLVYDELLSVDGVGLHLRSLPVAWAGTHSFSALQQSVAEKGGVLLGVKQGSQRSELNLAPDSEVVCDSTTQLVVMK